MLYITTYIGSLLALVGLVLALWQYKQNMNLKKVIRANSWFNFRIPNNSNNTLEKALNLYKEKHKSNIDVEILENLSKANIFGQEVLKEGIRQIQFSEPSFTKNDIEAWVDEGKITETEKVLFLQLSDNPKKKQIAFNAR